MIDPIVKNTNEVRQGENAGRMPIVLGLSIVAIILVFGTLYGFTSLFAAHQ